jgi:hypothetical protein
VGWEPTHLLLRARAGADPDLGEIAKIVHEADLDDERYDAPEAPGLDVLLRGLSMTQETSSCSRSPHRCSTRSASTTAVRNCSAENRPDKLQPANRREGLTMKWVTRERPKTDRIACPWLIRNFIDSDAEFLYVPAEHVLDVADREGAHSYDAPGAEFTHRDGLCSFEVLVDEYAIDDPAVKMLARIVHGADVAEDRDATPQSLGLLAIAEGFHLLELGDHRQLELSLPVYDALYAWCKGEVEAGSQTA